MWIFVFWRRYSGSACIIFSTFILCYFSQQSCLKSLLHKSQFCLDFQLENICFDCESQELIGKPFGIQQQKSELQLNALSMSSEVCFDITLLITNLFLKGNYFLSCLYIVHKLFINENYHIIYIALSSASTLLIIHSKFFV